jgi:hypothetical protein
MCICSKVSLYSLDLIFFHESQNVLISNDIKLTLGNVPDKDDITIYREEGVKYTQIQERSIGRKKIRGYTLRVGVGGGRQNSANHEQPNFGCPSGKQSSPSCSQCSYVNKEL